MDENILIPNPQELNKKLGKFKSSGNKSFHVIADFDKTLTKFIVDGKENKSSYAHFRDGDYLTPDYAPKSYKLRDEYYPIEISTVIPQKEKNKKMEEWWDKHWKLMQECGMNLDSIHDVINKNHVQVRSGCFDFFDLLSKNKIPLLIFSSGFGNLIEEFLKIKGKISPNIHIISNFFKFDKNGKAISHTKPLIHVFNKSEVVVKNTPYHKEIMQRKNIILIGDSLGDLGMTEGIKFENIIRIGFLNNDVDNLLKSFSENFDIIILNDGPMDYINDLIKRILL